MVISVLFSVIFTVYFLVFFVQVMEFLTADLRAAQKVCSCAVAALAMGLRGSSPPRFLYKVMLCLNK